MTAVAFAAPDIALLADIDGTRIVLPQLEDASAPQTQLSTAPTHFDGQELPTVYRGEHVTRPWTIQVEFTPEEQTTAAALVALIGQATGSGDGRLLLRTAGAAVAGLDVTEAVVVTDWTPTRLPGGGLRISITATAVPWELDE